MKIEVGMYVRTDSGITKVIWKDRYGFKCDNDNYYMYESPCILKEPSFNIIDLIEIGDYVNGYKIVEVNNNLNKHEGICNSLDTNLWYIDENEEFKELVLFENEIKSIVTKEQFESVSYKVGE